MRTFFALLSLVIATGLLTYSVSDVRLVRFKIETNTFKSTVDVGIFEHVRHDSLQGSTTFKDRISNDIDRACPAEGRDSIDELDRESCLANKSTAGLLLGAGGIGVIAFIFVVLGACCCSCKGCTVFLLSLSTLMTTGAAVVYGVLVYPQVDAFAIGFPNKRFDFGFYFMCGAAFFYLCSAALLSGSGKPPPKRQPYYSRF